MAMMRRGRGAIQTDGGLQRGMTAGLQTERQKQRRDMWGEKGITQGKDVLCSGGRDWAEPKHNQKCMTAPQATWKIKLKHICECSYFIDASL